MYINSNEQWLLITIIITVTSIRRSLELRLNPPHREGIIDYENGQCLSSAATFVVANCEGDRYELVVEARGIVGRSSGRLTTCQLLISIYYYYWYCSIITIRHALQYFARKELIILLFRARTRSIRLDREKSHRSLTKITSINDDNNYRVRLCNNGSFVNNIRLWHVQSVNLHSKFLRTEM